VIGAATIRAVLEGMDVVGVRDGFDWLMQGDIEHITPLTIDAVSRIHFRGGSHIGISRANPTSDPKYLENVVISLLRLDGHCLILYRLTVFGVPHFGTQSRKSRTHPRKGAHTNLVWIVPFERSPTCDYRRCFNSEKHLRSA
jgi:hypothetical protein